MSPPIKPDPSPEGGGDPTAGMIPDPADPSSQQPGVDGAHTGAATDEGVKNPVGAGEGNPAARAPAAGASAAVREDARFNVSAGGASVNVSAPASAELHLTTTERSVEVGPPATLQQKIWLSIYLVVVTVGVVIGTFAVLQALNKAVNREVQVRWEQPEGVQIRSGPTAFRVDPADHLLMFQGQIDETTKNTLVSLAEPRDASYERAIDYLAYESRKHAGSLLILMLILGGIGSIIGVHIRSTSNFLGVACHKNDLDVNRWWPWYAMRPVLAFLVGMLVVVLVKSDLLSSGQKAVDGSLWWLGLAALAGFGVEDVMERLRVVSKTLFATEKTTDVSVKTGGTEGRKSRRDDAPVDGSDRLPPSGGNGSVAPGANGAPGDSG